MHTYETPQRPDALILLDTSQPQARPEPLIDVDGGLRRNRRGFLRPGAHDASPARSRRQGDLSGRAWRRLTRCAARLACARYHRQDDFARVLLMTAPACARPDRPLSSPPGSRPRLRMQPSRFPAWARMRYTLVTAEAPSEEQGKLLDLLRVRGLEALHVRA